VDARAGARRGAVDSRPMFPVLFSIPEFPAWIAAVACLVLGGVFAWLGRRDRQDSGSFWLAGACGVGALVLFAVFGTAGTIGPLPIRMFGILVVLGFLAATKVVAARNQRLGLLTGDETFDMMFYVLLAGLAGGRLLHVLQNSEEFAGQPAKILKIWDGGLVWYGGALGGVLFAWWWLAKRRKDLWSVTDSIALAAPLGHAIGRLGCFCAGCDFGKRVVLGEGESPPWWAVRFPDDPFTLVPADFRSDPETGDPVYLHPVQLYLALFDLALFAVLFLADRRASKGAFPGRLTACYLMLYALGRAAIETFRGDVDRGVYFGGSVSFSQILSALVFAGGLAMWRGLRSRAAPGPAA